MKTPYTLNASKFTYFTLEWNLFHLGVQFPYIYNTFECSFFFFKHKNEKRVVYCIRCIRNPLNVPSQTFCMNRTSIFFPNKEMCFWWHLFIFFPKLEEFQKRSKHSQVYNLSHNPHKKYRFVGEWKKKNPTS